MAGAQDHLRRHVLRRAAEGVALLVEHVGPAEICDFEHVVREDEDVFGLDVAVDDGVAAGVEVDHGGDDLAQDVFHAFWGDFAGFSEVLEEAGLGELGENVNVMRVFEHGEEFYDVGVVAALEDFNFVD